MNRRDSLKALSIGSLTVTAILVGCKTGSNKTANANISAPDIAGRQDFEVKRDEVLAKATFFNAHEMATITVLANIIIPKDERSGNASDAEVPKFIEFIVKDEPEHQLPVRGGLRWLDVQCLKRHNNDFVSCTARQRIDLVNQIAYPTKARPAMQQGVAFFNKMRDLTAIGFFTSKMGIADLGYKGNAPGKWDGVPLDELKKYGLEKYS